MDAENQDIPDLARPLTAKGRKQAGTMAKWIDARLPEATRILVSPALRARETADALGRKYTTLPNLAPGGLAAHILLASDWPDARRPVLVVGHQPALGRAASLLLLGQEQDMSLRKAGVWWITNRSRKDHGDGQAQLTLRAAMCPDLL
ncbi:MAG: histidine phosphatase family protein [Betaproteobacteria bacterium]|nr:histidine phosphatase family protein [Betaproteobacteria bacterium]